MSEVTTAAKPATTGNSQADAKVAVQPTATKQAVVKTQSKIVWIKRRYTQSILPEEGLAYPSAESIVYRIGAAFAGPGSGKPLGRNIFDSVEEENSVMSKIVGLNPQAQNWNEVLDKYWHSISVEVPYVGLKLEAGTQLSNNGTPEPINPYEYALYRYCLKYGNVANEKKDMGKSDRIYFYMWSEEEERTTQMAVKKQRDAAFLRRMEIDGNMETSRAVLRLMNGFAPVGDADVVLALAEAAEQYPIRFLEVANDKDLLAKLFVEDCINAGLLSRPPGSTLILADGSVPIGNNLIEAVGWLRNPPNVQTLRTFEHKLNRTL
jgi:hypothetical protein